MAHSASTTPVARKGSVTSGQSDLPGFLAHPTPGAPEGGKLHEPTAGRTVMVAARHSGFTLDRQYEYEGLSATKNHLTLVTCENVGVHVCTAEVFEMSLERVHRTEFHNDVPYIESSVAQGFLALPSGLLLSNYTAAYSGRDVSSLALISDSEGVLKGHLWYSHSSFHGNQFHVLRPSKSCPQEPSNVYDVDEVTFTPHSPPVARIVFQICHLGAPLAFDVSSDGQYFAVMRTCSSEAGEGLHVSLYRRLEPEPCATFCTTLHPSHVRCVTSSTGCPPSNDVTGDICFSKYRGREVLRVASSLDNSVYVLEHTQDCHVITTTDVFRPRRLAAGQGGQLLWILSDQQVLLFSSPC